MNKEKTTYKIASNTAYQIIGKVATMSITILATILITRFYGREAYGEFSLMQGWPALVFIIVDFGLNAIATRELSKDFSKANKYIGNILILRLLISLFFIISLGIALAFFPYSESLRLGIRLCLLLILTQSLFTTTNIVFQTKLRYDLSTISLVSGYMVILGAILAFSYFKLSVVWVSFSYVLGGIVTFLIALRFLATLGVKPEFKIDKDIIKNLLWQTLPIGIMFIFSQLNFKEDEILLSVMKLPTKFGLNNTESVAVYALPYKIFEVALVVPTFFMNAVYPVMVRHMTESSKKLKKTFLNTMGVLVIAGIGAGLAGIVFSKLAINLLGGAEFYQSITILKILLGGLVFYYITQPISWLIVTLGKQKYLPYVYLIAAVFNLAMNLVFIPKYSFYAAAVVTHTSEVLILIMLLFAAKKAWKLHYA
ncbi:flippase [Patescibacteria group bacterium]